MKLEGKVAIITGAGQGIGRAYAERFLTEGARVAIADIDSGLGERASEECSKFGECAFVPVDVSDEASANALAADVLDRWGRIDILVNNAAIYGTLNLADMSFEYLQRVMAVNMFGAWIVSAAVVPQMIRQGGGSIVNQSSDAAFLYGAQPNAGNVDYALPTFHYSWSKWGVVGLSRFMAGYLGPKGVRVNCLCPGVTMTEATKSIVPAEAIEGLSGMSPLRTLLQPEDLCGACVFFASDESRLVTGQTLSVDGGLVMV